MRRTHVWAGFFGLLLGICLSRMGFTDWGEVHRMFTLADPRLVYTFLGAVCLTMGAFAVLGRGRRLPDKPLHRGTIPGSALFGAGWALSGACPSVPLVQLGEGRLTALLTLLGLVAGILAHRVIRRRWLPWSPATCD